MTARARYWILHWVRVALWPLPVLTLFRVGRAAAKLAVDQGSPTVDFRSGF